MKGEWHDRGDGHGDRAIHAEFAVIVAVLVCMAGLLVLGLIA